MKLKINIMKQRPEISDEEIRSYMNFQELLSKQAALRTSLGHSWKNAVKWTLLVVVVISTPIIYYGVNQNAETIPQSQIGEAGSGSSQQLAQEIALDTTATNQDEIDKTDEGIKPIDKARNEVEKSEDKSLSVTEGVEKSADPSYTQAEPIDGYDFLYKYFSENLEYPESAVPDSIQGVVVVSFVINKLGKPVQIEFVESLGEPFELESKRLIENMPAWKPANLSGKPVDSKMTLPITFQIKQVNNGQK